MSGQKLLELTPQEVKAGITPAATAFMSQAEEYTAITPAVRELVDGGRSQALYIPAVKYIMNATLSLLTQASVAERLPAEIGARSGIASHFANFVVDVGLHGGMFLLFYGNNPDLNSASILKSKLHLLGDPRQSEYLRGLGSAPFFDTSVASGGAFKFLQENGIAEDRTRIIAKSSGLLAISGVNKDSSDAAYDYLGTPYARTDRLRFAPDADENEVAFTEETAAFLGGLHKPRGGCPSGRITAAANPDLTLLEDYWAKLVDYMVPPHATADLPQD